jgi:hypothetical protein
MSILGERLNKVSPNIGACEASTHCLERLCRENISRRFWTLRLYALNICRTSSSRSTLGARPGLARHAISDNLVNRMSLQTPIDIAGRNPLLVMFEMGMSIADVKQFVRATLEPFVSDVSILDKADVGLLAVEAVQVGHCIANPIDERLLHEVLRMQRHAIKVDRESALAACASWEKAMAKATSEHWSFNHLEISKTNLPLEEFRAEIFRNIGGLIEGCVKPGLGHLLSYIRIAKAKPYRAEDITALKLGQIVDEIFTNFSDPELIAPSPWGIRLNQWRNIAHHHSSFTRDGKIVGEYKEGRRTLEITLSREEAFEVALRVGAILGVLSASRRLFMLDNAADLRSRIVWPEPRHETNVLQLSAAVSTQGFVIEDVAVNDDEVTVVLRDATILPWQGRAVHCSQFVLTTWLFFPKAHIKLRLHSKDDASYILISALGNDIKPIANGSQPFEVLAQHVKFTPLKIAKSDFDSAASP